MSKKEFDISYNNLINKEEEIIDKNYSKTDKIEEKTETKKGVNSIWQWIFLWILLWIFWIVILKTTHSYISILSSILIVIPIRIFWDKFNTRIDVKTVKYRLQHARPKYKIRTILSVLLVIVSYFIVHTDIEYQKEYNNAPTPVINILSNAGDIGEKKEYTLIYQTDWATEVIVNNQSYIAGDEKHSIDFFLKEFERSSLDILIVAKNEYKSTTESISIFRNKTIEEEKRILREEEERLARAEDERIEKERLAKEQETKRASGIIEMLNNDIETVKNLTMEGYLDNYFDLNPYITNVLTYLDDNNTDVVKKSNELKTALTNFQKKLFPELRKNYCTELKSLLWRDDIEVKCNGTTIEFKWYHFIYNANIEDAYKPIKESLYLLRFNRAEFRSSSGRGSAYTINSPQDWEIILDVERFIQVLLSS